MYYYTRRFRLHVPRAHSCVLGATVIRTVRAPGLPGKLTSGTGGELLRGNSQKRPSWRWIDKLMSGARRDGHRVTYFIKSPVPCTCNIIYLNGVRTTPSPCTNSLIPDDSFKTSRYLTVSVRLAADTRAFTIYGCSCVKNNAPFTRLTARPTRGDNVVTDFIMCLLATGDDWYAVPVSFFKNFLRILRSFHVLKICLRHEWLHESRFYPTPCYYNRIFYQT